MNDYTWTTVAAITLLGLATTTPAGSFWDDGDKLATNTASLHGTSVQGELWPETASISDAVAAGKVKSITLALNGNNTTQLQGTAAHNAPSNSAFKIKSVTLPSSKSSDPGLTSEGAASRR
jgi:hypothetical protein